MLNPRIHMICGMCGCNNMLTYSISTEFDDDTDEPYQVVYIFCKNCSSLTGLDEIIDEEKDEQ